LKLKYCGAVIVAAGNASRMEGIDKVMAPLGGEPMLARTVRTFQNCDAIREIVVVTRPDQLVQVMGLCKNFDKVTAVIAGGKDRPESVTNGLNALSNRVKLAAIHDGARPLVTWQVIDRAVRAANTYGAAAPGIPVKDTVKIVAGGVVNSTPDRATLRAIQTPQVFDFDLLRGALKKAKNEPKDQSYVLYFLTQEQLARKIAGLSASDISAAERHQKNLTQEQLKKIAKATGVTQASLLNAPKGASSAKSTASKSSMQVTATERWLVELYRKADSAAKKEAMQVLKGEDSLAGEILETILEDIEPEKILESLFEKK
jgi:2-C-methyl-D-erythritol 4-phosphate cytidylyltransferase